MKKLIFTLTGLFFLLYSNSQTTIHDFRVESIIGDTIDFSQYRGKKVLIVNTASYCTYTPQYALLQQLYQQYNQYNFEILGFPCNDFGNQDPGSDSTINQFCHDYNVTFRMMAKVRIITSPTDPIYKWLQLKTQNGVSNATVDWNFNKFLIDEAGHWVRHVSSPVSPLDASITSWIMSPSVLPMEAMIHADRPVGCSGDTIQLNTEVLGQSFNGAAPAYQWSSVGDGQLIQDTAHALLVLGTTNDVSVKVDVTQGVKTAAHEITVSNADFSLNLIPLPATIECGESVSLTAWTNGSASSLEGQNYQWSPNADDVSSIEISEPGTFDLTVTNNAGCSRSASIDIESNCATGLVEVQSFPSITLLPNPSNDSFVITTKKVSYPADVNIYDELGRNVSRLILHQPTEQLNLNFLPSGVYLLSVNSKDRITSSRFTISK